MTSRSYHERSASQADPVQSKIEEQKSLRGKVILRIILLLAIAIVAVVTNLCTGDVSIAPSTAFNAVFAPDKIPADQAFQLEIIQQIRLPRALIAMVVGTALSVAGYLLQSLSRNHLADPYLTGVSSGAGVVVAVAVANSVSFEWVPLLAFLGGLLASVIVGGLARTSRGFSVTRLLLAGVGLSTICGGIITLVVTLGGDPVRSQGIFFWLAGGISGRTWGELIPAAIYTLIGLVATFVLSKQIRMLSVGTEQARGLGVNVDLVQWALLFVAVLLSGAAVSVSGIVGFVGLVAPHIARNLFGRDERAQIFASALIGMVLVLFSDLLARTLVEGQELPLSTLLSLVGGPFFLFLVSRQKSESV
ncbi:MAG: iron ABC transporter permease [Candidatus Melainabacteria bacterium]|nr:iron ABC transporter permease [Candidatus Melainabacteria bacterium]